MYLLIYKLLQTKTCFNYRYIYNTVETYFSVKKNKALAKETLNTAKSDVQWWENDHKDIQHERLETN